MTAFASGHGPGRWSPRRPGRQRPVRRRLASGVRLLASLLVAGVLYTMFAPGVGAGAPDDTDQATLIAAGEELYRTSCITCHGDNAHGVPYRGPSLIGVGSAAVEFQVSTGRMPLTGQGPEAVGGPPALSLDQARQIGQYIQSLGGGPQLPDAKTHPDLGAGGDVARGGDLFRLNCSSCHSFGAGGGALSSGKSAPSLDHATDRFIYGAMLTGPENMPVFGDNQLSPQEKADIISYIQHLQSDPDPGGWGMGRIGPAAEGLAIFLVGTVALVFTALWISGKT